MASFISGTRTAFAGTVKQHGTRLKQRFLAERWILMVDVVRSDTEQLIAKRVWLRDGEWSKNMKIGHRYVFHARMLKCHSNQQAPGISGRINAEWRIANPTKVREVSAPQKAKVLAGEEILTFKVQAKRRKGAGRKSGQDSQEQRTDSSHESAKQATSRKARRLNREEPPTAKADNEPRKKIRRKSRSKTILSIFDNRRESGPGRARHWTG